MQSIDQAGEHDFGRLFVRYQPRIYGFIRSLVVSRTDAEDLLQETASVLWRRFDEFRPGSNFLAWALTAARFQVMYFRQRQRKDMLRFSDKFLDAVGADTTLAAERLGEMQELLEHCMDKLPDADRDIFELRYRTDLTPKALAERLGRPQSTVYNAVNRIRRVLAECVERAMNQADRK
jgi:RNA polymerase sigma-70 factor (ECF subfamily)